MQAAASLMIFALLSGALPLSAQTAPDSAVKPGPGVTLPVVVSEVKPAYSADAMRDGVEGSVMLVCVVNVDGTVRDVRVVESLDPRLDEQATMALRQWRFRPGAKGGTPVPVQVEVQMTFSIGRDGPALGSREVHLPGARGVTLPKVLHEVKPSYSAEALRAGVEGLVTVDVVVLPSGRVGDTRVRAPLEPSLDKEAIKAVKQWRFEPGKLDGLAVPVQVSIDFTFTVK